MTRVLLAMVLTAALGVVTGAQAPPPATSDQLRAKIAELEQEVARLQQRVADGGCVQTMRIMAPPSRGAQTLGGAAATAATIPHEWALSTNLGQASTPPAPTPESTPAAGAAPAATGAASGTDEGYWRGRYQALKAKLEADIHAREPLTRRLAQLSAALNPNLPSLATVGAEMTRVTTEVQRWNAIIRDDYKAIDDLREAGRTAGAFPGWMR